MINTLTLPPYEVSFFSFNGSAQDEDLTAHFNGSMTPDGFEADELVILTPDGRDVTAEYEAEALAAIEAAEADPDHFGTPRPIRRDTMAPVYQMARVSALRAAA